MGLKDRLKRLKEKIMESEAVKDEIIYSKYGDNIHDIDLTETIKTGIVDRLMHARELGIPYCIVFGSTIPVNTKWDPYGNGVWNPPRDYITTDDIAEEDNDREKELQNIYTFLRGEKIIKTKGIQK